MDKTHSLTSRSPQSKEDEKHGQRRTTQDTQDCDRGEGGVSQEHKREPCWSEKTLPPQKTSELLQRMRKLTCKGISRVIPDRKQRDTFKRLPIIHSECSQLGEGVKELGE